jgi:hypothetical protein
MEKVREVIAYQDHFENFLKAQTDKVQNKIFKVIEAIETLERVPETYLKPIKTKKGLNEARVQLGSKTCLPAGRYGGCFVFSMKESL